MPRSRASRDQDRASAPSGRDSALIFTAASLYYVENRSQDEIARQLSVSRSTVSRLLAHARQTGVVRIEVVAPPPLDELELELARALGLEGVYLAHGIAAPDSPGPVLASAVGQALLDSDLQPGEALLVSWGRATWSVARATLPSIPGVIVVPALGGLNDEQPWVQTNEIARQLAASLQGSVLLLHAPAVPSAEMRSTLLTDDSIRAALSRWDDAAAILVGIGAWKQDEPAPPAILCMQSATLEGSAGDVAARLIAADGSAILSDTDARLLGVSREQLQRIPRRIGVAVGLRKMEAIRAAARSGLINILVTDIVTATALAAPLWSSPAGE